MLIWRSVLLLLLLGTVTAWDSDELEVFDVVDEVNQNFYTLLGVDRGADATVIKKAFRKLSLVLHPDKNDAPDADVQFRQLVAVHDILKDPNKRKHYNNVLDNGLPDWRQAVYYYRRVRRMGLWEMAIILFIIVSIGQYLYGWAAYFERKLTVEDYLSSKSKKLQKKQKRVKQDGGSGLSLEEFEDVLVKPSVRDTLPCQLPRWLWFLFFSGPPLLYQTVCQLWHDHQLRKQQQLEEQEEVEEEVEVVPRAPRKRKTFVLPELIEEPGKVAGGASQRVPRQQEPPVVSGGLWTDDDLLELARLLKKHPAGSVERWERVGAAMRRPAAEVAHMAHKLKEDVLKSLQQREDREEEVAPVEEPPRKVKTKGGKVGEVGEGEVGAWSQVQQKALEAALLKYPKGAANDRWEKIAKCVPQKTKEECMIRYKYLVDLVKKKKDHDEGEGECGAESEPSLLNGEAVT